MGLQCFLRNAHAAVGQHGAFQWLVGLHADNSFQRLVDVARAVRGHGADDFGVGIKHTPRFALGFEQLLEIRPELLRLGCRTL